MNHDSKRTLWRNVSALMQQAYGGENLTRLARECKFSPSTSTRLKNQQTSVGLEVIDTLAVNFHVRPGDLLDQSFDCSSPPRRLSPIAMDVAQAIDRIKDPAMQLRAHALAMQMIEFGTMAPGAEAHSVVETGSAPGAQQDASAPMREPHHHL